MTLIERVARAIALNDYPDGRVDDVWQNYLPVTRVVLQELQNPSDAMARAGAAAAYDLVIDAYDEDVRRIFAAMIDAALVDGA